LIEKSGLAPKFDSQTKGLKLITLPPDQRVPKYVESIQSRIEMNRERKTEILNDAGLLHSREPEHVVVDNQQGQVVIGGGIHIGYQPDVASPGAAEKGPIQGSINKFILTDKGLQATGTEGGSEVLAPERKSEIERRLTELAPELRQMLKEEADKKVETDDTLVWTKGERRIVIRGKDELRLFKETVLPD
jgi:hypothetical protein